VCIHALFFYEHIKIMTFNYTFALFPTFKATTVAKAPVQAPAKAPVQEEQHQQQGQQGQQRQQRQQGQQGQQGPSLADRFSMNRLIHYKSPGGCRSCS
jgi:hypothetical protein